MVRFIGSLGRGFGGPNPVVRAAHRAAESDEPDESAVLRLSSVVASAGRDARVALKYFADYRGEFETDRAYRLLEAAVKGEAVLPIREDCRELFGEEERLGRMPLADAFAVLAECTPGLRELAASASASADGEARAVEAKRESEERRGASSMLLYEADDGDALLDSVIARSIVAQYLQILEGSDDSDPSCAYFALPRKRVVLVTRFGSR
jgi:hypothetical protein